MTKIEYSDFYKFLASLGVVLISLALLLPWLFLREPFDTSISQSDLTNLTSTAQAIVNTRQTTALWFLQNVTWVSVALSIAGVVFLSVGVFLWAKKQRVVDEKEHLETEKLKREIENMTPSQIAEKVIRETEEDASVNVPSTPISHPMRDYFRIEEAIINKLTACFGQKNVLPNRRIRDKEYDIILLSDRTYLSDVIFEIKATAHRFDRSRILDATHRLSLGVEGYAETTGRKVTGIVLLVMMGSKTSNDDSANKQQKMIEEIIRANRIDLQILLITEDELMNLNCDELKAMVYPARYGLRQKVREAITQDG